MHLTAKISALSGSQPLNAFHVPFHFLFFFSFIKHFRFCKILQKNHYSDRLDSHIPTRDKQNRQLMLPNTCNLHPKAWPYRNLSNKLILQPQETRHNHSPQRDQTRTLIEDINTFQRLINSILPIKKRINTFHCRRESNVNINFRRVHPILINFSAL